MIGWICNNCWKQVPEDIKEGILTVFRVPVLDGPNCIMCGSFSEIETKILASLALSVRWLKDNRGKLE